MITLKIDTDAGDTMELTMTSAVRRMDPSLDPGPLIMAAGRGERVRIRLADGTAGTMYIEPLNILREDNPRLREPTQLELLAAPEPMHPYEVDVKLLFAVDCKVYVAASDQRHATDRVEAVLRRASPPSSDIKLVIDEDEVSEHVAHFNSVMRHPNRLRDGMLPDFVVQGVHRIPDFPDPPALSWEPRDYAQEDA